MISNERPTSLDELDPGAGGTIVRIGCPGPLRRRLMDMGLTPSAEVRLEGVAPLGDPIIVSAEDADLASEGLRLQASSSARAPVQHACPARASKAWPVRRRVP